MIDQNSIDKEVQSSERGCVVENNNINHDTGHPPKHQNLHPPNFQAQIHLHHHHHNYLFPPHHDQNHCFLCLMTCQCAAATHDIEAEQSWCKTDNHSEINSTTSEQGSRQYQQYRKTEDSLQMKQYK